MVSVIVDNFADGLDEATILENYPSLTEHDIKAAIDYDATKRWVDNWKRVGPYLGTDQSGREQKIKTEQTP